MLLLFSNGLAAVRFFLLSALLAVPIAASQAQPAVSGTAEAPDTTVPDTAAVPSASADWLVLPFANYTPSTGIAGGLLIGYYLPAGPQRPSSDVQAAITVTQRRQLIAELTTELYSPGGQWRVVGAGVLSQYPDRFYGIGDGTPALREERYTSRYGEADVSAQRWLRPRLRVGPRLFVRYETDPSVETTCGRFADGGRRVLACNEVPGSRATTTLGFGGRLTWDARDNRYYPTRGAYADVTALAHLSAWGSSHTFGRLVADLRGFRSVGPGVLAGQAYTEAVVGTAPFQLLPLLGGAKQMRGYREGRYRDQVYWTMQAEYRMPLFWRLKATAFAAVGDVGPALGPALARDVDGAVGIGGRLRFTDDGVHGRLDLAYSPTGVEVYMTLGEAF